jgi:hypothetical protein
MKRSPWGLEGLHLVPEHLLIADSDVRDRRKAGADGESRFMGAGSSITKGRRAHYQRVITLVFAAGRITS